MADKYPRLIIDLDKLRYNINYAVEKCGQHGISVAGVIKGANGIKEILPVYLDSDLNELASSRLEQLRRARDMGWTKKLTLIRIPMISEVKDVVELTDMSLNSEIQVLKALDQEAGSQHKKHQVLLMADLGDLREGYWDKEEMVEAACQVERDMPNLILAGIGTNLGCYGALVPTKEKTRELIPIIEEIEARIGRKLDIVSGGASTSYPRVLDGDMPEGINHLRMGEQILLARDNEMLFGHSTRPMEQGTFCLQAEVIEVKDKPSYPVGEINVDAFGRKPTFEDRGIRRRALVAVGRVDYGSIEDLFPREEGVEILGASSDHTILDVQDALDMGREIKVGDVLSFDVDYASMVYLTSSENIDKSISTQYNTATCDK